MKKVIFKTLAIITIIFTLISCGGGGGGDSTTPAPIETNDTYVIDKAEFYQNGYRASANVTGQDSDGTAYSGTMIVSNEGIVIYNSRQAISLKTFLRLSSVNGAFASIQENIYDYDTLEPLAMIIDADEYQPLVVQSRRDTVDIGDFGNLTTWQLLYTDYTFSGTWLLEGTVNGNAIFITDSVAKFQGVTQSRNVEKRTINNNGDIVYIESESHLSNGFWLKVSGPVVEN